MIRYSDIDNALRNVTEYDGVDVLFSHDCPDHELLRQWLYSKGYKVDDQSSQNREALTVLLDRVRPTEMYHGHFHYRYTYVDTELSPGWEYTIHGVAANMDQMGFEHSTKAVPDGNCVIRDW
jgi:hypothetical protein